MVVKGGNRGSKEKKEKRKRFHRSRFKHESSSEMKSTSKSSIPHGKVNPDYSPSSSESNSSKGEESTSGKRLPIRVGNLK